MPTALHPELDTRERINTRWSRTVDIVDAVFKSLPNTPVGIARYFYAEGITGGHLAHNCPLANYLMRELTNAGITGLRVSVSSARVVVYEPDGGSVLGGRQVSWLHLSECDDYVVPSRYALPKRVADFVFQHDNQQFPFLEPHTRHHRTEPADLENMPADLESLVS